MKTTHKLLAMMLSVIMVLSVLPVIPVATFAETEGIFTYEISDGEATITGLINKSTSGKITIPYEIDGYLITKIGYKAFSGCTELTEVIMPNSIISIGNYAFGGCKSIASINVPDSTNYIAEGAFCGCSSLKEITLPFVGDCRRSANSLYQMPFGYIFGTFNYAGSIATNQYYDYSDPYSWMKYTCYYIPANLNKVTITDCEYMPRGAFLNCSNIASITLPNNLIDILHFLAALHYQASHYLLV